MTELVFILDRSGSMAGLEADTIGGFNAMIEKQKREPGPALVSTVLFSNESEVIHDRLPAARTCRSGRCSSSQRTDWRTPADTMIMRRCVG